MKYKILLIILIFCSCDWAKQKSKETVNEAGQVVGKAGSEFANGVTKGVVKTFENEIQISEALKKQGLRTGKVFINGTDSTTDNILTAYLIFDNDIDQKITIKILTDSGQEYGRVIQEIKGSKGEAHYVDFIFDKRTNIDGKGIIQIE